MITRLRTLAMSNARDAQRSLSLIRALQLASGTLPVGTYAYSQGLEFAVEAGWVNDERTLASWLEDQLMHSFGRVDLPVFVRLHEAMRMIAEEGSGVLVYMRQEGRGIGLVNKIKAYVLQDQGMDTEEANVHLGFDPDPREYGLGAQILKDLGITTMRLITNNPVKRKGLQGYGLEITVRVPIEIPANPHNHDYLKTKQEKFGHHLSEFGAGDISASVED